MGRIIGDSYIDVEDGHIQHEGNDSKNHAESLYKMRNIDVKLPCTEEMKMDNGENELRR